MNALIAGLLFFLVTFRKEDLMSKFQKMPSKRFFAALALVCILNFLAHLALLPRLPDMVPMHWNAQGTIDAWIDKHNSLLFQLLPLAMTGILYVIPKIDPRSENYKSFGVIYSIIAAGVIGLFILIGWLVDLTALKVIPQKEGIINSIIYCSCAVIFFGLGLAMPYFKQNYLIGAKTPWALNDEHNWTRTQAIAGKVFIFNALLLCIAGLDSLFQLTNPFVIAFVISFAVLASVIGIYVYSYLLFRGTIH